ncbi:MAG: ESCRT-0 subunit protein hse1 [Gomphillus americanus]|uniref:Class E vacuolar protein-sorting machinery protein HSE1 n=1 Tax=Gomphillus americanus TaxID=1940652 RepID=A0A8H3EY26_9LECA|nr:MAG: ESCRT-0 subunit protein hse1 [Gomphillus americanus]
MFRAQQNIFDDAVAKATDENLTSENWEYILDVCDKANGQDSGAKDVVAALIKRLAHRNANVQLYTLELANALVQNCGVKVHRELASRSFTEALLRLAGDRNTHQQVKARILEKMGEWTEIFSRDPDLGVMSEAYHRLKTQNPNLQPPSKPTKRQITDVDRKKEEEELQMALELSVKDRQSSVASPSAQGSQAPHSSAPQSQAPPIPHSQGTTAATVSRVRALFDFQPSEQGELQFKKGDIIAVLESVYKDWWKGSLRGQVGIFPLNYVEKLTDPTPEELEREAQMEVEVFGQIKNVEKLLTLLSTSSSDLNNRDNEEITTLYHGTLAIRPKLIELISKYSQKKDDFTQLNEKFIKARRDYESLLEASMVQPAPSAYGRPGYPSYGSGHPPQGMPPQNNPARYYTPGPQDVRPGQPSQAQFPPTNGPQPIYMASQPQSSQAPYGAPVPDHRQPTPSGLPPQRMQSDPYGGRRPESTYENPQELGTYPSGTSRPPTHLVTQASQVPNIAGKQPGTEYSPSIYAPEDGSRLPAGYDTAQNAYQMPQQHAGLPASLQSQYPSQPSYPTNPQYNTHPSTQSPNPGPSAAPYPNLGQPQQTYQAYQPPPTDSGTAGGDGYYR